MKPPRPLVLWRIKRKALVPYLQPKYVCPTCGSYENFHLPRTRAEERKKAVRVGTKLLVECKDPWHKRNEGFRL